jgi:starvation-inducible DNA-binding protein
LSRVLADTYSLYLKTHNFHWNVEGPMFNTLHLMFMDQYTELWNALDAVAERIRSLGYPAPGTGKEFAKLTSIVETEGVPEAWTWCGCWSPVTKPWRAPRAPPSPPLKRPATSPRVTC